MNEPELLSAISRAEPYNVFHRFRTRLNVPFLQWNDFLIVFEKSDVQPSQIVAALSHLETFPSSFSYKIAQALFDTCLQSFADCDCDFDTPQHQLDYEKESSNSFPNATVPRLPDDMWGLVRPIDVAISSGSYKANSKVPTAVLRFEAAWDGEHGVSLLFPVDRRDFVVGGLND
jgi:hypothetical protein